MIVHGEIGGKGRTSPLADTGNGGYFPPHAGVVKLVDTRDLKSLGFGLAGSSPAARTIHQNIGDVGMAGSATSPSSAPTFVIPANAGVQTISY